MDYSLTDFRLLFDQGSILRCQLEKNALSGLWFVGFFTRGQPNFPSYLLDSRRKERKEFKSLNSALRAVEDVGFDVKLITIS